jgi:hypothetical protein
MSSPVLVAALVMAGVFTIALGVVHLWIPRIFRFGAAIGRDDGPLPVLGDVAVGPWRYRLRRADALGLSWVMSNAASVVLVSIGLLDLAWVAGWRGIPLVLGGAWIAIWWLVRAGSQLTIGRRRLDWVFAGWFGVLALVHVAIAVSA